MKNTTTARSNYTYENGLLQSRNGGLMHEHGCGHRSRYAAPVTGSTGLTREQIITQYGTSLCAHCFPEAKNRKVATPAKLADTMCEGSNTRDWANGTEYPERWGYYTGNGGKCGHCDEWVGVMNKNNNPRMRKHKK